VGTLRFRGEARDIVHPSSSKRELERFGIPVLLRCFRSAGFNFLHAFSNALGRERSDWNLPRWARDRLSGVQIPISAELHDGARANR
jgi:hypothetical protein